MIMVVVVVVAVKQGLTVASGPSGMRCLFHHKVLGPGREVLQVEVHIILQQEQQQEATGIYHTTKSSIRHRHLFIERTAAPTTER